MSSLYTSGDEVLRLRQSWPEEPNMFTVFNEDGDSIGRIAHDITLPAWRTDRWSWMLSAYQYRHRPDYAGHCATREEAMATLKAAWPRYKAELEYDGVLERVRRERLGVRQLMFIYHDQYDAAPGQIEALAGCLEGTVEEARLSLLCQAMEHQDTRQIALQVRVDAPQGTR